MQQKENVVVKNQVILNSIQDLQRLPLQFINNMRGRFQIKFGMTTLFNNAAFTLIELLVVVLIIGILAAVALPQYKKAVIKSRVATILPVLSSIIQAQEVYYLANGQYTDSAELTDSQLPATCTKIDDTGMWKCGNNWLVDIDPGVVLANYCPKHNSSFADCKPNRDFQIGFGSAHSNPNSTHPSPNARSCWKPNNSSNYGEEICKALGKPVPGTNTYELY